MKRYPIVKHRRWFFLLSGLITVAGLIVFIVQGFNLGPDFTAGSRVQLHGNLSTTHVERIFEDAHVPVSTGEIAHGGTAGNSVTIVRLPEVLTTQQDASITQQWHGTQIDTVDPFAALILSHKAILAVLLASVFIMGYVAIRFEHRFAISGIVALLHDAFIVMSAFALFRIEVNLLFVTAVLTIVGYSINDTIVIFGRIRENMKLEQPHTIAELEDLTDRSLWQTMRRSIHTVATVLAAAVMLYFFGGPTIHHFTLALIVGLLSGAYSSIFIASPLWVSWRGRQLSG